jgi:large subunit ribosomal protein L1
MPTPKAGTVTPDVATAVKEFAAGKIEFRADSGGNVHAAVGKRSFENDKLADNIRALIERIASMKPAATKGAFFERTVIAATMSPGIVIKV